jgi:hypothetical protein
MASEDNIGTVAAGDRAYETGLWDVAVRFGRRVL